MGQISQELNKCLDTFRVLIPKRINVLLRLKHGLEKHPCSQTVHLVDSLLVWLGTAESVALLPGGKRHSTLFQRPTASGSQRCHFKLVWRAPACWIPQGASEESDSYKPLVHTHSLRMWISWILSEHVHFRTVLSMLRKGNKYVFGASVFMIDGLFS